MQRYLVMHHLLFPLLLPEVAVCCIHARYNANDQACGQQSATQCQTCYCDRIGKAQHYVVKPINRSVGHKTHDCLAACTAHHSAEAKQSHKSRQGSGRHCYKLDHLQSDRYNLQTLLMQNRGQAAHELPHINDQFFRDGSAAETPTCSSMAASLPCLQQNSACKR